MQKRHWITLVVLAVVLFLGYSCFSGPSRSPERTQTWIRCEKVEGLGGGVQFKSERSSICVHRYVVNPDEIDAALAKVRRRPWVSVSSISAQCSQTTCILTFEEVGREVEK